MMQWEKDERTIRDCPGGRTEIEWREAVRALEKSLAGDRCCSRCGQRLADTMKYRVTETESWMPSNAGLPRGRWALYARAYSLRDARKLQAFMGARAKIWKAKGTRGSYEPLA